MTLEEIKQEAIRNLIETLDNEEGIVLRDDNDDILPYIDKAFDSLIAKAYEEGYEAGKKLQK